MDSDPEYNSVVISKNSFNYCVKMVVERLLLLRLLYQYVTEYKYRLIVAIITQILSAIPLMVPAYLFGMSIDAIFLGSGTYRLPLVPQSAIPDSPVVQFLLSCLLVGASYVSLFCLSMVSNWTFVGFYQRLADDLRVDTYNRIQRNEMKQFDSSQTGDIVSRATNDIDKIVDFLRTGVRDAFNVTSEIIVAVVLLAYLSPSLALLLIPVVILIAGINWYFSSVIGPLYRSKRGAVGAFNAKLQNNISGIDVIKTNAAEPIERENVDDASNELFETNWEIAKTKSKIRPLVTSVSRGGQALVFLVGGLWVLNGTPGTLGAGVTIGALVTFLDYVIRLMRPARKLPKIIDAHQEGVASASRIAEVSSNDEARAQLNDGQQIDTIADRIEFRNVKFSYDDSKPPTIDDVSFAVEAGSSVGIVGRTGAGKSTLVKILLRLYSDFEGSITIDGVDIEDASRESLRKLTGYVSQEPFLFTGTVAENIAYGAGDPTIDQIVAAARDAKAHQFITDLPHGYETEVGERGVKLSGGQRQRITLARALVRDPDMLIIDEGTSAIDNETQFLIRENLESFSSDRTTFRISHRISTVRNADQILVLDDGRIAERGTHEELLDRNGLYSHLWRIQVGDLDELPEDLHSRNVAPGRTD